MGMFDTITCEYPLPDAEHQDLDFQTKDLESLLDHYVITRNGRLIRKARRGALQPTGPARDVPWPLHGDLRFYTSTGEGEARQWIEYLARFSHGRVEWIRVCERWSCMAFADERTLGALRAGGGRRARPRRSAYWGPSLPATAFFSASSTKLFILWRRRAACVATCRCSSGLVRTEGHRRQDRFLGL